MHLEAFDKLTDQARIWIYGFDKPLGEPETALIDKQLSGFMTEWNSHKVGVYGAFTIVHKRFAVLSGESTDGISGCSIDSSVANFKHLRDVDGLDGLNRALIFFRNVDGDVQSLDRAKFQERITSGELHAETIVFDTTLQSLGGLRAGRFEIPLSESWHAQLFLDTTNR